MTSWIRSITDASTRDSPKTGAPPAPATKLVPGSSVRSISAFTKKKSLSWTIGPLSVTPDWRKLRSGFATTFCPLTSLPWKFSLRKKV